LVEHGKGVTWVSPRDSDSGGTWVGANTHGVAVAIANLFAGGEPVAPARKVSRGLLVHQLLDSPSPRQVAQRMGAIELAVYEPFTMVSLAPGRAPVILRWDRIQLSPVAPLGPVLLVTSAGGNRDIERGRTRLFAAEGGLSEQAIEALYRAPPGGDSASICVHRTEVATVSLTRIDVSPQQVALTYTPGQPCTTPAAAPILLTRI
jgi:hypothetical protein